MWAAVWLLMRRVFRDGRQVALSGRLWALLGLLALSPLLSELAFSMWDIRAYTLDGTDEMIDAAFYTLLPFVFVSAIALLFAAVLLSRHQALEQEHQLADMRELYYQGIRREQEQVRRLRHDMRNHLTALSGLLEQPGGQLDVRDERLFKNLLRVGGEVFPHTVVLRREGWIVRLDRPETDLSHARSSVWRTVQARLADAAFSGSSKMTRQTISPQFQCRRLSVIGISSIRQRRAGS